jgi:hypothetical protein
MELCEEELCLGAPRAGRERGWPVLWVMMMMTGRGGVERCGLGRMCAGSLG